MARPSSPDDRPVEGEILPPEHPTARAGKTPRDATASGASPRQSMDWRTAGWGGTGGPGLHRVYVAKVSPLGLVGWMLLFGVVVAVVLAITTTVVLFMIPVIVALIAIGIVVRLFRGRFAR